MQHKITSQTENLRLTLFKGTNQDEWTTYSTLTRNTITKMIGENKNLFDIYDFARAERRKMAIRFRHTNQEDDDGKYWFGAVRNTSYFGDYHDVYTAKKFAASEQADDKLYQMILHILIEQSELFDIRNVINKQTHQLTFQWLYQAGVSVTSKSERIVQYSAQEKAQEGNVNISYYKKEIFQHGSWHEQPDILSVIVKWGDMNREIYAKKLNELDSLFNEIKECVYTSKECLKKIGYLAYDLARLIPCGRGSAFNAGITIKGIAAAMRFPEIGGNMHVHGLPFDVYAHLQQNRDQYAEEFCNDVGLDFNLLKDNQRNLIS